MTETTCAICLDEMTEDTPIFALSCKHSYHTQCFKRLVFQNGHSFVDCPLCRTQNTKGVLVKDTPGPREGVEFLETWFADDKGARARACCHMTKKGKRCRKKAVFLNNGSCRTHQRATLPEDRYPLFAEYVGKILGNILKWPTKIYLIDLTKQLLIRYPEIQTMGDIEHRMNTYYHLKNKEENSIYSGSRMNVDPNRIYEYYKVPVPQISWIAFSVKNKTLT